MITPYVTINTRPEFSRNKTGFGYMVMDIAKAVSKTEEVELLATDTRGEAFTHEGSCFLKRSIWGFILSLHLCISPFAVVQLWRKYRMSNGALVRLVYYWLMTGYLNSLIKKGEYDVVHIHGCSFVTELWMRVCRENDQKFVVTLHGLNSFSDTVKLEQAGKKYERDFLKRVTDGEIPITVISSGMKKLVEKTFNAPDCSNISLVCNSFNFKEEKETVLDVRKKYEIPQNTRVLLYVGNISYNKNQAQMVRAFGVLSEETQENTYVLFCGADHAKDGVLQDLVETCPNKTHLILCGAVDKSEMISYYKTADGVVLLSFSEGFGLSLVEGMHFGLPCVMHQNLDAFEDIYDEMAVVAAKGREDASVANAIDELISRVWDKDAIKKYSKKFESETMAQKYIEVFHKVVG